MGPGTFKLLFLGLMGSGIPVAIAMAGASLVYVMATGEQPFPGESMTAVSYKVVHTEPVPPRKLNPSIPLKLESMILKCLTKNPDERYQTGEDLARDLGEEFFPDLGLQFVGKLEP